MEQTKLYIHKADGACTIFTDVEDLYATGVSGAPLLYRVLTKTKKVSL